LFHVCKKKKKEKKGELAKPEEKKGELAKPEVKKGELAKPEGNQNPLPRQLIVNAIILTVGTISRCSYPG
jgi:hypothetical protein